MSIFPTRRIDREGGLPCISCTETMKGVHSHDIRLECEPCGGKSLAAPQRQEERREVRTYARRCGKSARAEAIRERLRYEDYDGAA